MALLLRKLQVFEQMLEAGEYTKAAIIAEDIKGVIHDPVRDADQGCRRV